MLYGMKIILLYGITKLLKMCYRLYGQKFLLDIFKKVCYNYYSKKK